MGRDAQPFAIRHHPGIGEPHPGVDRLTSTSSLAGKGAGGNCRIAKHSYLQIGVVGAAPGIRVRSFINLNPTEIDGAVRWSIRSPAAEVLPRIVEEAWGTPGDAAGGVMRS
jgi:hypothetical protein